MDTTINWIVGDQTGRVKGNPPKENMYNEVFCCSQKVIICQSILVNLRGRPITSDQIRDHGKTFWYGSFLTERVYLARQLQHVSTPKLFLLFYQIFLYVFETYSCGSLHAVSIIRRCDQNK